MAIKLEGGGKALMAWPLVEKKIFAASLTSQLKTVTDPLKEIKMFKTDPNVLGTVYCVLRIVYIIPVPVS